MRVTLTPSSLVRLLSDYSRAARNLLLIYIVKVKLVVSIVVSNDLDALDKYKHVIISGRTVNLAKSSYFTKINRKRAKYAHFSILIKNKTFQNAHADFSVSKNCWIRQFNKLPNLFEFSNFEFSKTNSAILNSAKRIQQNEFSNFNSTILICLSSELQLLKYINFDSVIATLMKNIIVYFSITNESKVTGFENGSTTIQFLSQCPLA